MIIANDCLILQIFQMDDGETGEEVPKMDVMIHQQAEREAQRVQANREELVERIGRAVREDGLAQPLQGLHLYRFSLPLKPVHSVLEPSLCAIAQGSKEVLLGDSRYRYDPSRYLLATVELPRVSQVLEASKERPLPLGIIISVLCDQFSTLRYLSQGCYFYFAGERDYC